MHQAVVAVVLALAGDCGVASRICGFSEHWMTGSNAATRDQGVTTTLSPGTGTPSKRHKD